MNKFIQTERSIVEDLHRKKNSLEEIVTNNRMCIRAETNYLNDEINQRYDLLLLILLENKI